MNQALVVKNGHTNLRLNSQQFAEFEYSPGKHKKIYRIVVLRKNIAIEKGDLALFDEI